MREIVLDTETTGLDPVTGDRLVEVACVEILNLIPTGETFHVYLNPERDMPQEAFKIHGLSADFLRDKPLFRDVASQFMAFIGESRLVIHNAEFDIKFLNSELGLIGLPSIAMDRVFDTLSFARKKHPGASNSLDALCSRYKINNAKRTKHGALLDSELLAEVYVELMGGRQTNLILGNVKATAARKVVLGATERQRDFAPLLSPSEVETHGAFVAQFPKPAIWGDYFKAS